MWPSDLLNAGFVVPIITISTVALGISGRPVRVATDTESVGMLNQELNNVIDRKKKKVLTVSIGAPKPRNLTFRRVYQETDLIGFGVAIALSSKKCILTRSSLKLNIAIHYVMRYSPWIQRASIKSLWSEPTSSVSPR